MIMLSEADVTQLLSTGDAVTILEAALHAQLQGTAVNSPRKRTRIEQFVLHVLPAASVGPHLGAKLYMSGKGNPTFLYVLFGPEGFEALIAADQLGRMRTGAASGLATKYLSAPDASRLVQFGAGNQAFNQIEAVASVRPITHVSIFNRSHERAAALAATVTKRLGITVECNTDLTSALARTDVISTMTSSATPLFSGRDLPQSVHINAAGSNRATHREIDEMTLDRAQVIMVDDIEQARSEAGDFLGAARFDWGRVQPLSDIFALKPSQEPRITLFESLGIGLWDLAMASELVTRARARGLGFTVDCPTFFAVPSLTP